MNSLHTRSLIVIVLIQKSRIMQKKKSYLGKISFFVYAFACSFKEAALSVRSQGRSTSVRPKCPYAAVCL